jgi:MFS family permease
VTASFPSEAAIVPLGSSEAMLALEAAVPAVSPNISKEQIRSSLRASTLDGVFATIFTTITGGVLLSNFLVELKATPLQFGMLASIPMLVNLLQPLGAHWADRMTSRRRYNLWVHSLSRLLWLPLAVAIVRFSQHPTQPQQMILATLAVMLVTHLLGAIASASWLSWLATLVPRQLRGRYFGFRNSTFSLTSLIALPLLGTAVSHWGGGSIQGFGLLMAFGVGAGLISLVFQARMVDVNPQDYCFVTDAVRVAPQPEHPAPANSDAARAEETAEASAPDQLDDTTPLNSAEARPEAAQLNILDDFNFRLFLLYFGLWAFGVNLSNPFFNLYLLDNLALDLNWVTLYNVLGASANLLLLLVWGKLADRIGNRPILLLDGLLVALIPLLWLGTDAGAISIWLWLPLLHLLGGGAGAAIDLCLNNLQLAIAPRAQHTKYFAVTAAVGGVAGAVGALAGGWLAQLTETGGMTGLFALSSLLRLVALLPLVWLQEPQQQTLRTVFLRWTQLARSRFLGLSSEPTKL